MIKYNESRITMEDGIELFIRDWLIENHTDPTGELKTRPCIVILHGLGEHSGRYDHIASFLTSCGFSVRAYDQRGHGQSGGARGDVPNSMSMVNDAEIVIRDFAQRCQSKPLLFGHSMGGLVAARIATAATAATAATTPTPIPLRGLILSSPALALRLTPIDRFFLKLMKLVAPHFAISTGLKPTYLSHKLAVAVAYINDPLVHNKITASLLDGMLSAIKFVQAHASMLTVPTLLLVAEDDQLVHPEGSHTFFDALPSHLCTAHFYPGFYHEIFNELDSAQVFEQLQSWLTNHQFTH